MGVGVAAYAGTELIAYIAVVYAGYRSLEPSAARPAGSSIVVGVARVITYVAVYVPTRWLEWSLIALTIAPSARSWTGLVFGTTPADRWWRLLGIVVSCAADIPLMLSLGGLPLGRFLC
jgi:hypothetical protein